MKKNGPNFCYNDYENYVDLLEDVFIEFKAANIDQIIEFEDEMKKKKTVEHILIELRNVFVSIMYFYESTFSTEKIDIITDLPMKINKEFAKLANLF